MSRLKLIPTILVKIGLRFVYGLVCLLTKVDEKKVTFASYRSNTLQDNLAFVEKEMARRYPEYKRILLFKKMESSLTGKMTYTFHMVVACYHLATSRYFIIDDYYFPVYMIKPRPGTEVIQLWHSAGALKKFGLSTVGKPFGPSQDYLRHVPVHGNYARAYVSSEEVVPYYAEAFNMPAENIYPLGVPRTDYFFSNEVITGLREDFCSVFPELLEKKILLYAPTFRGKSHYQEAFRLPFDVEQMKAELGGEYALLIHLHPYMQSGLEMEWDGFAYHMRDTYVIEELLAITDILITDYSTVFFDFSILQRPMIFYPYDLEDYIRSRDFYYQYEDVVPGPMATDTTALIKYIREGAFDLELVSAFRDRFFDHQDGRAASRIVEHLFGE